MLQTVNAVIERSNFSLQKSSEILKKVLFRTEKIMPNTLISFSVIIWNLLIIKQTQLKLQYLLSKLFPVVQISSQLQVASWPGMKLCLYFSRQSYSKKYEKNLSKREIPRLCVSPGSTVSITWRNRGTNYIPFSCVRTTSLPLSSWLCV